MVDEIGNTQSNRIQLSTKILDEYDNAEEVIGEVLAHELGHTGGLRHEREHDKKNPRRVDKTMGEKNLMNANGLGLKEVSKAQMKEKSRHIPKDKKTKSDDKDN